MTHEQEQQLYKLALSAAKLQYLANGILTKAQRLLFELEGSKWHYCPDWDELLIGSDMPEMSGCTCDLEEK